MRPWDILSTLKGSGLISNKGKMCLPHIYIFGHRRLIPTRQSKVDVVIVTSLHCMLLATETGTT